MRFALCSLLVNFRSTLEFFANRERAMLEYHPKIFPHWQRGDRHFNLIDTEKRKVIRFEPSRFVIRVEGHDSINEFEECVNIAITLLDNLFNVKDVFYIQVEINFIKKEKSLFQARHNFAKRFFLDQTHILPMDENTDYQITFERDTNIDENLHEVTSKLSRRFLKYKYAIITGPVTKDEVISKFLEFKEIADNELYKTKVNLFDFAQYLGNRFLFVPKKRIKFISVDYIKKAYDFSASIAENTRIKIFGE
jgi:hypothetical protein